MYRKEKMPSNSANTFMLHRGKMSTPHWRDLCEENVIKHRPLLNSMRRANVTAEEVYPRFMDSLPRIFSNSSIPKLLREVPVFMRDRRWIYLNPHSAVVKLRPGFPIENLILKVISKHFFQPPQPLIQNSP